MIVVAAQWVEQPVVAMAADPGAWSLRRLDDVAGRETTSPREGVRTDTAARQRHTEELNHPTGNTGVGGFYYPCDD